MTQAIDSPTIDALGVAPDLPPLGWLPPLPSWVVPRERLAHRLDRGVSGGVTQVTGPTGWGKTIGVASWAATASEEVIWLSAAGAESDPDLVLDPLRERLVQGGGRHLTPAPPMGAHESRRTHALAALGRSLGRGRRRVLVLDDYPTGETGALGRDLGVVLDHSRHRLSLVVISRGQPALAVQRHHVAGDLTRISVTDLAMDWHDVAGVLSHHEVVAQELTAQMVQRHTDGWALGVRLAAVALRDACSVESALAEADRASVDYLTSEVLRKAPACVRTLLVQTSMVDEVDRGLARAVGGPAAEAVVTTTASEIFGDLDDALSFRCPPLLRKAAAAELAREPLEVRREATRRAAQWHVDNDGTDAGLAIAIAARDWSWVGHTLVQSYVVPQILSGGVTEAVGSTVANQSVRAAEPLIEAALRLRNGGPDGAESALALLDSAQLAHGDIAGELSEICVRLAAARGRGAVDDGMSIAAQARELLPQLPIGRQPELIAFVEAQVGSLAVAGGQLAQARAALRRGE